METAEPLETGAKKTQHTLFTTQTDDQAAPESARRLLGNAPESGRQLLGEAPPSARKQEA